MVSFPAHVGAFGTAWLWCCLTTVLFGKLGSESVGSLFAGVTRHRHQVASGVCELTSSVPEKHVKLMLISMKVNNLL